MGRYPDPNFLPAHQKSDITVKRASYKLNLEEAEEPEMKLPTFIES